MASEHLTIPWSAQLDHDVNQNCQSSRFPKSNPKGKVGGGGWGELVFRLISSRPRWWGREAVLT